MRGPLIFLEKSPVADLFNEVSYITGFIGKAHMGGVQGLEF